jgi:F-type H+-transporting ATPase subunit b
MLIDWFTVAAQTLNFIVLVLLLRRFLYAPVLAAIDQRERKIAGELSEAARKQLEAQQEQATFRQKNEELDRQRSALVARMTEEVNAERRRLVEEALRSSQALAEGRQAALRNDARNLNQAILRRAQQEVFAIARKALGELASATLEASMVEVFVQRLRQLDGASAKTMSDAVERTSEPLLVRSAFELQGPQRSTLEAALRQAFSSNARVQFATAPELVGGLTLSVGGHKLGWSITDYLAAFESALAELVETNAKTSAGPARGTS